MTKLKTFEYQGVTLLPSHYLNQFEQIKAWLLNLNDDSLLYGYREMAGLSAPGHTYPGWYGNSGCVFGQLVGALAKIYAVTKDERLRDKCFYLLDEWAKTMGEECSPSFPRSNHSPYGYEKTLGGLLDAYEYAGYEMGLKYAKKITEWADRHFKRDIAYDGDQNEKLVSEDMIEWYTLPENLSRAYRLSKDEYFLNFAREWEYPFMWDKLAEGRDDIPPRHAYSHVNSLSSAAGMYLATGDQKYLDTITKAYDLITDHHMFVTGGYGPAESLYGEAGYLGDSLLQPEVLHERSAFHPFWGDPPRNDVWGSCEVPCSAWAIFKITKYLQTFTGEARYGDWAERILVNGTGAQLPIADDGRVMYYTSYFIDGAYKSMEDRRISENGTYNTWQCCTGTTPQDMVEYNNLVYLMDEDALYVSQYLASKVTQRTQKGEFRVTLNTDYPHAGSLRFTVEVDAPMKHTLKVRVPNWVRPGEAALLIDGERVDWTAAPGQWGVIERSWTGRNHLEVLFPFHLFFEAVDRQHPNLRALRYGPLVLVTDAMVKLNGDPEKAEDWIHLIDEKALTFETDSGTDWRYDFLKHRFVPFYDLGEMKWYFMYNHVSKKEA